LLKNPAKQVNLAVQLHCLMRRQKYPPRLDFDKPVRVCCSWPEKLRSKPVGSNKTQGYTEQFLKEKLMSAKNKFLSTACLLGLACFALPSAAKADSVTVTITGTGGNAVGGVYVVPYYLTVVDGSQTSYISAICDDYIDEVKPPETWTGSIETFDASGNVIGGAGLFQGSVGNAGYDEAAWLYGQYLSKGTDPGGYNYAIWALFDPSIKTSGNPGNSGYASTDAAALLASFNVSDLTGFNYSGFQIITPTSWAGDANQPQEYIYDPTPTPEPGSLALFGSGLLGLAGLLRRKLVSNS